MENRYTQYLLFFLLCWIKPSISITQSLYPVTARLSINGPTSARFFTFGQPGRQAGKPNRINLDLRLNDLDEPSLDVRLKWSFASADLEFASSDNALAGFVSLVSGQVQRFDNAGLAAQFEASGFDGLSQDLLLQSGGLLPEGVYEVCVTAYELTQGKQVSNTSCQVIFLEELEPPSIILPLAENKPSFPQNLFFSWHNNHLATFPAQYTLSVWEEIPGLSPEQIVFSTPPLLTTTIANRTSFVYNQAQPLLTPGMHYLTQVQIRDNDDAYVFKNLGHSPIHRFLYGSTEEEGICEAPLPGGFDFGLGNALILSWNGGDLSGALSRFNDAFTGKAASAGSQTSGRAAISQKDFAPGGQDDGGFGVLTSSGFFRIKYRLADTESWTTIDTDKFTLALRGLKAGKTYDFQIFMVCSSGLVPSPPFQVTMPKVPKQQPQECGTELHESTKDQTPIDELLAGDTIMAAGSYVVLTNVEGSPSGWTGEGEVGIPFLPLARVGVEFNNILVNQNYELIGGFIETMYDETMSNVINLDGLAGMFGGGGMEVKNYSVPLDSVRPGPNGFVIVYYNGNMDSFKVPMIITAPGLEVIAVNGYVFHKFEVSEDSIDWVGQLLDFSAHPDQNYGFDEYNSTIADEYELFEGVRLDYKSVGYGMADLVVAQANNLLPDDAVLHFVETSTGTVLPATKSDNKFVIPIPAMVQGLSKVYAYAEGIGIVGMLNVFGTTKEFVTVHLVPLDGVGANINTAQIEEAANKILRQGGFSVRVDVLDVNLTNGNKPIALENHFASAYSTDMKAIISSLGSKVNKQDYHVYMILTDKMQGATTGYMPKGSAIGFMDPSGGGTTLAHEICHGLFNIAHPWEGFYDNATKNGLPDNLMDYLLGTKLYYKQWAHMQKPGIHLPWFDDEKEGKSVSKPSYFCINNDRASLFQNKCLLTYDGHGIVLSETLSQIAFYSSDEKVDSLRGRLASWRFANDGLAFTPRLNDKNTFEGYENKNKHLYDGIGNSCSNPIKLIADLKSTLFRSSDGTINGNSPDCNCNEEPSNDKTAINPFISIWGNDFEDKFNNTAGLRNEKYSDDLKELLNSNLNSCLLCVPRTSSKIDFESWVLIDRLQALESHTDIKFQIVVNEFDYVITQAEVGNIANSLYDKNHSNSKTVLLFVNLFKDKGYVDILNPAATKFYFQKAIVDPQKYLGDIPSGPTLAEMIAQYYRSIEKPHYSVVYKSLPYGNSAIEMSYTENWVSGFGEITTFDHWEYAGETPYTYIPNSPAIENRYLHLSNALTSLGDNSKFEIEQVKDLKDACIITYFEKKAQNEHRGDFLTYMEGLFSNASSIPKNCVFKELTAVDAVVYPVLRTASNVPGIDILATASGLGLSSYRGDVLLQNEFSVGLAMSVLFIEGKVVGEFLEKITKGFVVNSIKKKIINLTNRHVNDMAEFLTEEVGIAQTRSIRFAEKLHLKERENYGDYLNQSIYDRLGGARDDLEFEWRLALVFDEDAIFKSFINKYGVDKADEVWRFCQSQIYTDNQLADVFKYFGQSTNNNVEDILFLFSSGKGRIAGLLDDAFRAGKEADLGKALLNDLEKGSAEFVSYLKGKGDEGVKAWGNVKNSLDAGISAKATDVPFLQRFNDIVQNNNLGLDTDGLQAILNAAAIKGYKWDFPGNILDEIKRASDANIPGLKVTHKKFPEPKDGSYSYVLSESKKFQAAASGDANLSFELGGVSFDDVTSNGVLIDRKFGHGATIFKETDELYSEIPGLDDFLDNNGRVEIIKPSRVQSIVDQATRQLKAIKNVNVSIKWEISSELGAKGINQVFKDQGFINIISTIGK